MIRAAHVDSYLQYEPSCPPGDADERTTVPAVHERVSQQPLPAAGRLEVPDDATSEQLLHQVWGLPAQGPKEPWPHPVPPQVPEQVLDADQWMRDCPNFLEWLGARLQHWEARAAAAPRLRPNWRAQLHPDVSSVLPPRYNLNPGTAVFERLHGLDTLIQAAHVVQQVFADWPEQDRQPVFAKGDHEKAYRNWPVHPDEQIYLVSLVWDEAVGPHGGFRAYVHKALPFGALAAVWQYTRISQGVCHILARLFGVPQLAYVDDFLRAAPRKYAAAQENAFQRVHAMLGIPLN